MEKKEFLWTHRGGGTIGWRVTPPRGL